MRSSHVVCRNTLIWVLGLPLALAAAPSSAQQKAEEAEVAEVAKIASIQNVVETREAGTTDWEPSQLRQSLFGQARVRTGPASRAAILYSDKTLHRMNEKSELEVLAPSGGTGSGVLKVISGGHYFSSRTPKDYGRVETPTVTAAIKGTEFAVQVDADGTTTISMLEGVVEASNAFGSIDIGRGEQAYVQPGQGARAPDPRQPARCRELDALLSAGARRQRCGAPRRPWGADGDGPHGGRAPALGGAGRTRPAR